MSLELLLGAQLDAVVAAGGTATGMSSAGPFVDAVRRRGVRHVALATSTRGWNPLADVRAARDVWRAVRRDRPTILHTHNPKPGLYGRIVGRLAGVPIVINTVHGLYATPDDPWPRRAVVYALEAVASRFGDAELVQNIEDVETIRRFRLAPPANVEHLGNGVDLQRFRPGRLTAEERASLRARWGAGADTVVIGAVGRLVAEKGYPELFAAARSLGRGARVVVVGGSDPDKSDAVDTTAIAAASDDGVTFLGHRHDVDLVLGGFDVFVLASHREGQPRAAMEAAAAGLPVVATDIRGCRQVVEHGVTGMLVPVGDPEALRTALEVMVSDPVRRHAMGAAAVAIAHRSFDEREVVRRVLRTYAAVAARRRIRLVPAPT